MISVSLCWLFIHKNQEGAKLKVKYFQKCRSQKYLNILHPSPEQAERFETKISEIGESMQE